MGHTSHVLWWIKSVWEQDSWKCEKFSKVGFYPGYGESLMQCPGRGWWVEGGLLRWSYAKLGSRQVPALRLGVEPRLAPYQTDDPTGGVWVQKTSHDVVLNLVGSLAVGCTR